jgi:hypothetical protein
MEAQTPQVPRIDYPPITNVPLSAMDTAPRISSASGQRESATNRLESTVVWASARCGGNAKFSMSRLMFLGGVFFFGHLMPIFRRFQMQIRIRILSLGRVIPSLATVWGLKGETK